MGLNLKQYGTENRGVKDAPSRPAEMIRSTHDVREIDVYRMPGGIRSGPNILEIGIGKRSCSIVFD